MPASKKPQPDPEETTDEQYPDGRTVGDSFIYDSTTEGEIRIRLRFKTKLLRAILRNDEDEVSQVFALLDGIGDKRTSNQLDELDIFETTHVVTQFFEAFQAKNEARLGESKRSSN